MSVRVGSTRIWRIALGVVAVLSCVAMIPLAVASHQESQAAIAAVIGVPCAAVGLVVTRRQQDNPLGWLFLILALCQFVATDGSTYALLVYRLGHHHLPFGPVALALNQTWGPSLELFAVVVLLFPDGRLPSRFWRVTLRVYGVLFAAELVATGVATVSALAAHPIRVDVNGGLATVDSPTGWFNAVQAPLMLGVLVLSLAFIVRQALSWRRASGERRQQLKWLASGAAVTLVCLLLGGTFGQRGPRTILAVVGFLGWVRRRGAAGVDRGGDPEVPVVRDRPDHLPDAGLRDRHRAAGRGLHRAGAGGPAAGRRRYRCRPGRSERSGTHRS